MNKLQKLCTMSLIALAGFTTVSTATSVTYAQPTSQASTSGCPKNDTIATVAWRSIMQGFNLARITECKSANDTTAVIGIINAILNRLAFPILIAYIFWGMIKPSGDKQQGGGSSYGNQGGWWLGEGLKNWVAEKSSSISLLLIILGIWQLWFIDFLVFWIRVMFGSVAKDADDTGVIQTNF